MNTMQKYDYAIKGVKKIGEWFLRILATWFVGSIFFIGSIITALIVLLILHGPTEMLIAGDALVVALVSICIMNAWPVVGKLELFCKNLFDRFFNKAIEDSTPMHTNVQTIFTDHMVVTVHHSDENIPFAYIRCDRFIVDNDTGELSMYREDYQGADRPPEYDLVASFSRYSYYKIYDVEEMKL